LQPFVEFVHNLQQADAPVDIDPEPPNSEELQQNETDIPSNDAEDIKLKYKNAAKRSLLTNAVVFIIFFIVSGILQMLNDRSITTLMTMSTLKGLLPIATTVANFGNVQSLTKLYFEKITDKISNFRQTFL